MRTTVYYLLFFSVSLASSVSAHVLIERDDDLIRMQRNRFPQPENVLRLKDSTSVRTLFERKKSTSTPALARTESFYYIPANLNKIKCHNSGQISYDINNRPSIKNMSWEPQPFALSLNASLEKVNTHTKAQNTLDESAISEYSSRAVPTLLKDNPDYIAGLADVAFNIYQNFVEGKVSGAVRTILSGERIELCGKLLESGSLNKVLGNVFSYFFREDCKINGYRPIHDPIPTFENQ